MCLPKVTTQLSPFLHSFALKCTWKACIFKSFLGEAPQPPQRGGSPPLSRTTRLRRVEGRLRRPKADIWTPSSVFLAKSLGRDRSWHGAILSLDARQTRREILLYDVICMRAVGCPGVRIIMTLVYTSPYVRVTRGLTDSRQKA